MTRQLIDILYILVESRLRARRSYLETECADLIRAWLQQQSTRERPDTFTQTAIAGT